MALDIRQLRVDDWRNEFADGDFERGQTYAAQARSRLVSLTETTLQATCMGTSSNPYHQRITVRPQGQGLSVTGKCNCPVGNNCKHVVSALITLQKQQEQGVNLAPLITTETVEHRVDDLKPSPILSLGSLVRVHFDARKGRMQEQTQHRAALAFAYQEHIAFGKQGKDLLVRSGQRHLRIVRDLAGEALLRKRLEQTGLQVALRQSDALPESAGEAYEHHGDAGWLGFMRDQLPQLREEGWQINVQPDFQYNLAHVDNWYAEVEEDPEQSWFDLELGIEVEGQRISLLPILLQAIRRTPWLLNGEAMSRRQDDEMLLVSLPHNQKRVALPLARLKPLLATLGDLFVREPNDAMQRVRLSRLDASQLNHLQQGPELHWQGGAALREFASQLQALDGASITAPQGLNAELRAYQQQGLAWMQGLAQLKLGGLLADDMGLGKTLQTLGHILAEFNAGRLNQPALIVMPTSLIPNWQDEAARFTPQLKVLALHGPKRRSLFKQIADHQIILTTYALLPRDLKALSAQRYRLLILDEAQNIKNPRSKAATAAAQLHADQRLCLTGTPVENNLGELWSLFNFLMPGWLGDIKSFTQDYRIPIEKNANELRLAHLNGRIKPFILRRTKEQVATELPPKTEITHWVELTAAQRDRYETLRLAMDQKVRSEIARQGLARSQIVILEALLRLRQACCDLRLLEPENAQLSIADSGKLSALLEMLEAMFAQGRRVLLFSQFTGMLALIEAELKARKITYCKLTGSTQDRRTPVEQFQSGEIPIFLISLKAGGAGLNLTAADTVIHFDPWWNPAVEAQASDRAYRIGQDKPVFVYKLISRGSVEEKIQQLQQAKANLAKGVLAGGSQNHLSLNEDDLQALFAPLAG